MSKQASVTVVRCSAPPVITGARPSAGPSGNASPRLVAILSMASTLIAFYDLYLLAAGSR